MQIKLPHLGHFCFLPPQRALFSGYAMPNFQRKYWDCYYCWRYSAYFPKSCKTLFLYWSELNIMGSPHSLAASSSIQDRAFEKKQWRHLWKAVSFLYLCWYCLFSESIFALCNVNDYMEQIFKSWASLRFLKSKAWTAMMRK